MRTEQIEPGCIYIDSVGQAREVVSMAGSLVEFRRGRTGRSRHIFRTTINEMAAWAIKEVTEQVRK